MCESAVDLILFGIPIMVKSVPLAYKDEKTQEGFKKDSDMAAAAEQLVQLSGDEEDRQSVAAVVKKKCKVKGKDEGDQCIKGAERKCGLIRSEKIRKDDDHKGSKTMKRKCRYRSIDDIYMVTKPMNDFVHRKKLKS